MTLPAIGPSLTNSRRIAKQAANTRHGFAHRIGHDVAVGVHRQADLRMTEQFHHHARMHALGKQETRARMAQIVKPDAAQFRIADDPIEIHVQGARLKGRSDSRREH